jgi:hypothetical protein
MSINHIQRERPNRPCKLPVPPVCARPDGSIQPQQLGLPMLQGHQIWIWRRNPCNFERLATTSKRLVTEYVKVDSSRDAPYCRQHRNSTCVRQYRGPTNQVHQAGTVRYSHVSSIFLTIDCNVGFQSAAATLSLSANCLLTSSAVV